MLRSLLLWSVVVALLGAASVSAAVTRTGFDCQLYGTQW